MIQALVKWIHTSLSILPLFVSSWRWIHRGIINLLSAKSTSLPLLSWQLAQLATSCVFVKTNALLCSSYSSCWRKIPRYKILFLLPYLRLLKLSLNFLTAVNRKTLFLFSLSIAHFLVVDILFLAVISTIFVYHSTPVFCCLGIVNIKR